MVLVLAEFADGRVDRGLPIFNPGGSLKNLRFFASPPLGVFQALFEFGLLAPLPESSTPLSAMPTAGFFASLAMAISATIGES